MAIETMAVGMMVACSPSQLLFPLLRDEEKKKE